MMTIRNLHKSLHLSYVCQTGYSGSQEKGILKQTGIISVTTLLFANHGDPDFVSGLASPLQLLSEPGKPRVTVWIESAGDSGEELLL